MMNLESLQAPVLVAVLASAGMSFLNFDALSGPELAASAAAPAAARAPMKVAAEAPQPRVTQAAAEIARFEPAVLRVTPAAFEPGFASAWAPSLQPVAAQTRGVAACLGCTSH
ncbi:MAG: hypothetical protein ACFBRM_01780 [Pikeienuella sp.]